MVHRKDKVDDQTKEAIESAAQHKAESIIQTLAPDRWIELVFERGPLATLAAGGAYALARGLLGSFSIQEAIFGASLLLATALAELFIWNAKRRSAERAVERAYRHREAADVSYGVAEDRLADTEIGRAHV